jgi:dethiobiotin synthetase
MRGLFITGTDTGVGKTILSGALAAAMIAEGERVCAHKPVVSGLSESSETWPADHVLLAQITGMTPEQVAPLRYQTPASPHLAAALEGESIDPAALLSTARAALAEDHILIIEGVGGLLVPFTETYTVCDLARELGLGVLIAARPGLGSINHTLLTLNCATAAGLDIRAVVLTPWPERPSEIHLSNRDAISQMGKVDIHTLPAVSGPEPDALARAGGELPWRDWLI